MTTSLLTYQNRERYEFRAWMGGWRRGEHAGGTHPRLLAYFTNARYIDASGLPKTVGGDTFMESGLEDAKIGSTGRPLPMSRSKFRDDAGNRLGSGESGEICLRGPKVTPGYWRDPAKTAAAFSATGSAAATSATSTTTASSISLTARRT